MNIIDKKDCFVGPKSKPFVLILEKIYRFFDRFKKRTATPSTPRRILLCNWASLGDLVIATSIIPPLKHAYPEAKIGFLVAHWTKEVVEKHPDIQWIHTAESWKNMRLDQPLWRRFLIYIKSARKARREIKKINYDLSIELYPFFFNASALLWRCRIPERVGFNSAGFSSLLTKSSSWGGKGYLAERYQLLLKELNILVPFGLTPSLGEVSNVPSDRLKKLIPLSVFKKGYIILHMGSGGLNKEWKEEHWKKLAETLVSSGHSLIFTGKGSREKNRISNVISGLHSCYDLCDSICWDDLLFLIKNTLALVSLDSVTVHIAGAFNKPCIILFLDTYDPSLWSPSHQNCISLIQKEKEEITPDKVLKSLSCL